MLYLHQFFTSLIKKGRGIWPDDALATRCLITMKGANSNHAKSVDR